ncbi:MAG: rhamnulokinase [candidate division WOR-3 bacterium]|nr:rhamnulokinase [candidate division WOR-3 bacterium]
MSDTYLCVDLGAGSGRIIAGIFDEKDRLNIRELHRFPNNTLQMADGLHWDIENMYNEILKGLSICAKEITSTPDAIGIDTWGVDFGLLDEKGNLLAPPFSYRDPRTSGMIEKFTEIIPRKEIYQRTGIQFMEINTLYQIYSMVLNKSPILKNAHTLLFIPDIINYFLTGKKLSEFTFATTTQIYNINNREWDEKIIEALGVKQNLFPKVVNPGTYIGTIKKEISLKTGLNDTPVIEVASHDTASAIAAIPVMDKDFIYISSGTWSLFGIESEYPIINDTTYTLNFTNEGGVDGRICVLKNIMGLGILQHCKKIWDKEKKYTYDELIRLALNEKGFESLIDTNNPRFLYGKDMVQEIIHFCKDTNQKIPENVGKFVRCILESLAFSYQQALDEVRKIRPNNYSAIYIIGGGALNSLLCQFTANATGLRVYAGPVEATAIGNILIQAKTKGRIKSIGQLREIVKNSFAIQLYNPEATTEWNSYRQKYQEIVAKGRNIKKGMKYEKKDYTSI